MDISTAAILIKQIFLKIFNFFFKSPGVHHVMWFCNQNILVKCIFEDFWGPIQFKLKICSLFLYKKLTISYNIWNFIKFEFECILTLFSMFLNISIALLFCKTTTMNACKYISFICYLGPRYLIQILKLYFNL